MIRLSPEPVSPWGRAAKVARGGRVALLTERDSEKFALLPADLAHAALEALEDAEDVALIRDREGEAVVPWEQVQAELGELEAQGR